MNYVLGEIVLIPFPFSDLSSSKTRPALVISNHKLKGDDCIVVAITSINPKTNFISINNESLIEGKLPIQSFIKYDKIVTLKKTIIRKKVAKLNQEKLTEISNSIKKLIG